MADFIFYNGTIYTMAGIVAHAIAISGYKIDAVGTDEQILGLKTDSTIVIDLEGKCVVPGFIDSHCHVLYGGLEQNQLSLRDTNSIEELIERGREYIRANNIPEGTWIIGSGYDHNVFPEHRHPDVHDLDAISTRHPILIERVCGHIGAANTAALHLTGFDQDQEILGGGKIERDKEGNPTGILVETVLDLIKHHLPRPTVEESKSAIIRIFKEASSYGVTSMHTDDVMGSTLETVMQAYREVRREGMASVRIWEEVQAPRLPELKSFLDKGLRTGDGDRFFKIGNIKLITDGSLGARTAFLKEDYSDDPGNRGVNVYTQEELNEVVLFAHQNGMQLACHAIGDGSALQCASALADAYESDRKDLRNRIVHCQFVNEAILEQMVRGKVCADIQPPFLASDYPIVHERMGSRDRGGYAWKTLRERGIRLGGGSDSPVETFNPIWGIHCAVNRTDTEDLPEGGWHPTEKLTVEEAVSLYTKDGAVLSFEENEKGTLEPGKYADFVVLDKNIFEVPSIEIRHIQVTMTVMDGKIVYEKV